MLLQSDRAVRPTYLAARRSESGGAHVGAGGWVGGHAHRAGKWVQAQNDACTVDATAWCA
eukprot:2821907-Prymnesium_polylepis.1